MTSGLERLSALEVEVANLKYALEESRKESVAARKDVQERHDKMDKKLDDLLSMRDKGLGAFWLASALFGTGLIGLVGTWFDWWKGLLHG